MFLFSAALTLRRFPRSDGPVPDLHFVPRLGTSGAILQLPLYYFVACIRTRETFTFTCEFQLVAAALYRLVFGLSKRCS